MKNSTITIWKGPLPKEVAFVGRAIWRALHRQGQIPIRDDNVLDVDGQCIILQPYIWER